MVLSRNERNIRYSIRKFSIGVASVAVCCFFCASAAQAAENEGVTQTAVSSRVVGDSLKNQKTKLLPDETEVTDPNELDDIKNAFGQGNNVAPQPGGQPSIPNQVGSDSMPPKTADNPMPPKTPKESGPDVKPQLEKQQSEVKPKDNPRLKSVLEKGLKAIEELEKAMDEVMKHPELQETQDYSTQKKIWKASSDTARKAIEDFKKLIDNPSTKEETELEKTLNKLVNDFAEYKTHALIEVMTRQVAKLRASLPNIPSLEAEFIKGIKQTEGGNYGSQEGTALQGYFEKEFLLSFNKIQQIVEIYRVINQLESEMKAVPDGTKLMGEAGITYEKIRNDSKKIVDQGKNLLEQADVTEGQLNSQSEKMKKVLSELKVAKANLVLNKEDKKSNQGESNKQDKIAEAQKKVEEAEKKAKAQKEEDRRNYPTNTSKTIELEIAEAQVGVAKAELELAQAEVQTPHNTDKITAAKAKVETAKSKVKTLEKIKSDSERAQAGDQKPSMPAPDTKPDLQPQPEVPSPSPEPKPIPQPDGKQPSTPKEPENKKPSLPSPEKPKNSKIFTATDGKTKVTVIFDHSVDADKLNIKEVTSKELVDTITGKVGGGTVRVFELSLSKNGKETHVNGERTVRLALGQTGSGVQVYHVKENGELEPIPSKVENGDIVFKTNHFSLFAVKTLSQKQDTSMPGQDTPPTRAGKTQTKDTKPGKSQDKGMNHTPVDTSKGAVKKGNSKPVNGKESLPYTGTASHLVLEILGLLSLTATAVFAKKRRK